MEDIPTTNSDVDIHCVDEIVGENEHGEFIGNCKWFNKKLGYGFITVYDGIHKGINIFVHHSCIKPLNSNFRTLRKGEYVHFDVENGKNGLQSINVTGILGGPLMCDNFINNKYSGNSASK
jgi:cold shock CspA family protein